MADPSRFRSKFNGPEASAIHQEKFSKGCYGCRHSKQTKTENQLWYCARSVKGYPHLSKHECIAWEKRKFRER